MSRELKPDLFSKDSRSGFSTNISSPADLAQTQNELKNVSQDLKSLAARVHMIAQLAHNSDQHLQTLATQVKDISRSVATRFERLQLSFHQLTSMVESQAQEMQSKYASLWARLADRKNQDAKLEEMLERHHQIVRNFENRMIHLQRLLQEQEGQINASAQALQEARHEIARLRAQQLTSAAAPSVGVPRKPLPTQSL